MKLQMKPPNAVELNAVPQLSYILLKRCLIWEERYPVTAFKHPIMHKGKCTKNAQKEV